MVYDVKQSKPRGYAFIEYENERDMHCKLFILLIL
jgi:U1 small nuclear ribonucleoprotein